MFSLLKEKMAMYKRDVNVWKYFVFLKNSFFIFYIYWSKRRWVWYIKKKEQFKKLGLSL